MNNNEISQAQSKQQASSAEVACQIPYSVLLTLWVRWKRYHCAMALPSFSIICSSLFGLLSLLCEDNSPHFISVNIFRSEHVFSERENSKPIKLQDFREICSLAQKITLRARKRCLSNKNIMKGIVLKNRTGQKFGF